jgi:cob(I)alamin adenosyltransferase
MLFTGRGDDGTTKTFACDQRISKSSAIAEALGSVDEVNSLLGVLKMKGGSGAAACGLSWHDLITDVQHDLFIAQAELAGADKHMDAARVEKLSNWVNAIEGVLPPITTFFVSGGTALAACCDHARTVARRAERRVVEALRGESLALEGLTSVTSENHQHPLAYLNRLSSLLYALARLANHQAGVIEEKPHY